MDIKVIILASISFNGGHVQIDFEIYLTEIGHSVLRLSGIFSRKPLQETFKTGVKSRSNFPNIPALQQWLFLHALARVIPLGARANNLSIEPNRMFTFAR